MKMNSENLDLSKVSEFVNFCRTYPVNTEAFSQKHEVDAIERFKKGHKIKIKKKNVGSFTKYCGGNVTEECIRRGKNSSSSKIRKKATFADNARHWKH